MKVKGTIKPLRDSVFVTEMEFGVQRTKSGLYVPGDDGKTQGIHPRWGRVWAIGDEQKDIKVGDWILVEHGRWTRTVEVENDSGDVIEVRMVDSEAIMLISDEKPSDINRAEP
jgi:co-chaperonin GroES (HSP10)